MGVGHRTQTTAPVKMQMEKKQVGGGAQKEPTEIMNEYMDKNKSCDMEKQIQNNRTEDLKMK